MRDTPLEFAEEVLGWSNAQCKGGKIYSKNIMSPETFNYNDRNQVEKYLRQWCDKTGQSIALFYSPGEGYTTFCNGCYEHHEKSTFGLMAVCVEANRKLKIAA